MTAPTPPCLLRRATLAVTLSGAVLLPIAVQAPHAVQAAPLSTAAASTAMQTGAGHGDPSALLDSTALDPVDGVYGRFVDTYRANTSANTTPETNPSIGVLNGMLDYWQPGTGWNNGTALNAQVLDHNIALVEQITTTRTTEQAEQAYLIDRRNQNYSTVDGLGTDAAAFRALAGVGTSIPDQIPADATTVKYEDTGNARGRWADADSELGAAVQLVDTVRGSTATSNNAKSYYAYMRPFRWSDEVEILPWLAPVIKPESEAASDGGFPSGHTNAAFLTAFALGAASPEHADELVAEAALIGHSRVVAGMHSPLDVIGGRVLATAIAASTLADDANAELIGRAREQVESTLDPTVSTDTDRDAYQAQLARYLAETTFDFEPVGDTTEAPRVPAGAEVLLEGSLPYLTDEQRRWVLYSTALESGLPVTDDAEGWGRLNLFAATNGFGSFPTDVAITLDEDSGELSGTDVWRNDISGDGGLTVSGEGTLTLAGDNSFAGGVRVDGADVVATTVSALGGGSVAVDSGSLDLRATATAVASELALGDGGTVLLTAGKPVVADSALSLGGELRVEVPAGVGAAGDVPLMTTTGSGAGDSTGSDAGADAGSTAPAAVAASTADLGDSAEGPVTGEFAAVELSGPGAAGHTVEVRADGVYLTTADDEGESGAGGGANTGSPGAADGSADGGSDGAADGGAGAGSDGASTANGSAATAADAAQDGRGTSGADTVEGAGDLATTGASPLNTFLWGAAAAVLAAGALLIGRRSRRSADRRAQS
ncbi:MAG: phosphatase PAP2 family protein [Mycetocola sp.]